MWDEGLRLGDHVAIFMENNLRYVEVAWAAFMIISGGVNIYPQEIEDVLVLRPKVMHPKVMDVAVIGVPDEEARR